MVTRKLGELDNPHPDPIRYPNVWLQKSTRNCR
jgi:hypothetical protein